MFLFAVTKLIVAGFVIANFPCFLEFGRILSAIPYLKIFFFKINLFFLIFLKFSRRIPKKFNEMYRPNNPNDIVLITDNVDRWSGEYDHVRYRIIGLQNFMTYLCIGFWI